MSKIARMFMRNVFLRYRQYFNYDNIILVRTLNDNNSPNIVIQIANERIKINRKDCLLHAGLQRIYQALRENPQVND